LENFTSTEIFFEAVDQSDLYGLDDNHFHVALDIYGENAAKLFLLDYLVEHDDRYSGNLGHLRD